MSKPKAGDAKDPEAETDGSVALVTDAKGLETLKGKWPRVVLDFTATWCDGCKRMKPVMEELARKHRNIIFAAIDVDTADSEFLNTFPEADIIPRFVFIHRGSKLEKLTCGANPDTLTNNTLTLSKL